MRSAHLAAVLMLTASGIAAAQEEEAEPTGLPEKTRFEFRTHNNKFYLGVGAQATLTLSYDFHAPIDDPNQFTTFEIPMHPEPGQTTRLQLSAQQTRFRINAAALPGEKDQVGIFASFMLVGDNYAPSPEYAYLTWRGLTAGYNYGLFNSNCCLASVDYRGPNAMTAVQSAVLDYTYDFSERWSGGIGIELPLFSASYDSSCSIASQRIPDIPVCATYSWSDGNQISAAAILRSLSYYDRVERCTKIRSGWGVQLSGTIGILPNLQGAFQATTGKGIASYIQDLTDGGLDLCPIPGKAGQMSAVRVWSGLAGLQYNFLPQVFATATYSHVCAYCGSDPGRVDGDGSQFRYSQYATGNLFWDVNSFVRLGAEYVWGRRVDMNGTSNHSSRLQGAIIVTI